MNRKLKFFIALVFSLCLFNIYADGSSDTTDIEKGSKKEIPRTSEEARTPTEITSDSMDMTKQLIIFTGNVIVDDYRTTIYSDKMYVYMKKANSIKTSAAKKETDSKTNDIDKIIAVGNVVIIKKTQKDVTGKPTPVQKALGGRAVYDTKYGTIILTEKPRLVQGDSYVNGNRIIFWKDSDRMKVEGHRQDGDTKRSKLVISPEDQGSGV